MTDITFEELEILKKLCKAKKLTEKQREALKKLIQFYFEKQADEVKSEE